MRGMSDYYLNVFPLSISKLSPKGTQILNEIDRKGRVMAFFIVCLRREKKASIIGSGVGFIDKRIYWNEA